ncbi:MAG TPA: M56 family metallopeptidase [Candidatus Acidoferrales bacterium]|nr:M56 family metallopeptidase [Candidatus Acidoferrales bacterium]
MTLTYWPRLLSLCFASFFLINALAGLAVRIAERRIIRLAEGMTAGAAARLLFWTRILPAGTAVIVVAFACAPSYVRFEGDIAIERVGFACLGMALLGGLVWAVAVARGLRIAAHSAGFAYLCRRNGCVIRLPERPSRMLVIQTPRAFLALSGILRPCIVISQRLLSDFSGGELKAALGHERAHWRSHDNGKRLVLAFLPGTLPFWRGFERLERSWSKFAERAADDAVIAEGPGPALSLATALVRLARTHATMGRAPWLPGGASPLGGSDDLSGRVGRLLAPAAGDNAKAFDCDRVLLAISGFVVASLLTLLASPALQQLMHGLLERLLH